MILPLDITSGTALKAIALFLPMPCPIDDLMPFEREAFVAALLPKDETEEVDAAQPEETEAPQET